MENRVYILMYFLAEGINYLLAYKTLFQARFTSDKKKWIFVILVTLLYPILTADKAGVVVAMGTAFVPLLLIPVVLLDEKCGKWFALYPIIVVGISVISVGSSFLTAMILGVSEHLLVYNLKYSPIWQLVPMIILIIFYLYQRNKDFNSMTIDISKTQYIVFYIGIGCAMVSMSVSQILSEGTLTQQMRDAYGAATSVLSILFVITSLWQGLISNRENFYKKQNEMYEEYMKQQNEHIKEIIEQDEKMRRFRHDMNAHITAIKSYCEEADNDRLKSYLENVVEHSAIYESKSYTGNSAVDAVIRYLEEDAEQKGISIELKGASLEQISVSEYDLCTILSNLIKNAIEACEQLKDGEKRKIDVKICSYDLHLLIRVENPVEKEVIIKNNNLITTKGDSINHGLGSGNIKNAVARLGGSIDFRCDNGRFIAEVMI
ncbi:MAG: sensor histidine kinase [Lachnospiraceae bacterium]